MHACNLLKVQHFKENQLKKSGEMQAKSMPGGMYCRASPQRSISNSAKVAFSNIYLSFLITYSVHSFQERTIGILN